MRLRDAHKCTRPLSIHSRLSLSAPSTSGSSGGASASRMTARRYFYSSAANETDHRGSLIKLHQGETGCTRMRRCQSVAARATPAPPEDGGRGDRCALLAKNNVYSNSLSPRLPGPLRPYLGSDSPSPRLCFLQHLEAEGRREGESKRANNKKKQKKPKQNNNIVLGAQACSASNLAFRITSSSLFISTPLCDFVSFAAA